MPIVYAALYAAIISIKLTKLNFRLIPKGRYFRPKHEKEKRQSDESRDWKGRIHIYIYMCVCIDIYIVPTKKRAKRVRW